MPVHVHCPASGCSGDIAGFLVEADGKRLAAMLAEMEPALGRAVLGYLRLFKPAKQGLRLSRAVNLVLEMVELIDAGRVCADERVGVWRSAPPALWVTGIEQLLATPPTGLPLGGHNYLRKVVFTLAEKHEADAERRQEENLRQGRHRDAPRRRETVEDKVATAILYANQMLAVDAWTQEQRDAYIADAKAKHGTAP